MSNGALSQDEIIEMLKGDNNTLKDIVDNSKHITKEEKDELKPLLKVLDTFGKTKNDKFNIENRELKFSIEQLNKLTLIYKKLSAITAKRITDKIKCPAYVNFASINQLTVNEFSHCLPTPTLLGFFNIQNGISVIEIDTTTALAVIDTFNGKKLETTKSLNELSENDKNIINELFIELLSDMKEAWKDIFDIHPKLIKLESDPKTINIAPPDEMTAVITLQTKILEVFSPNPADGMINFCLPYSILKEI